MTIPNPTDKPQVDVSQRALAIARTIDRLGAGNYIIELQKSNGASNWDVNILGVVQVKEFKAYEPNASSKIDTTPVETTKR